MESLKNFIQNTREARELKRALAIQMSLSKRPWDEITQELGVSRSFISKWRSHFKKHGVSVLSMGHQGSKGYLNVEQKKQILNWLNHQKTWELEKLITFIEEDYGVVYQSKQSYYDLFSKAGISWKKSQKRNPKKDPIKIQEKRERLKKT
jgi:putative transposase